MNNKTFWPNNPIYLTFNIIMAFIAFVFMLNVFKWPILLPFPTFILLVLIWFFYSQRIAIDNENISGPIAYGKRRKRIKIPRNESEAFFEKGKFGFGHIVIRHKYSSKQILVPYLYFATFTVEELKRTLQAVRMDSMLSMGDKISNEKI